jgi:predicted nuclease with TOPRIM domain
LVQDEIVQPYEKIDLTDINARLNKFQDDIKRILVVPVNLNTKWETVKTNVNKVPELVSNFEGLNEQMVYFNDVIAENMHEYIRIVNEDVIPPIKQQRIDLKEYFKQTRTDVNGVQLNIEDVNKTICDIKEEVKKIVTIPSDLNEKSNSMRDNANQVPGLIDDINNFSSYLNLLEDNIYDRRCEIEQLQQDLQTSIDDKRGEIDELT